MGRGLVLLVNPNKVHPPIAPYALDVLTTSLEAADFEVEVVDLTFHREDWKSYLCEYLGARSPCSSASPSATPTRSTPSSSAPSSESTRRSSPRSGG